MNHKNDNDWYEGLERMDHSAPSTATATAKTRCSCTGGKDNRLCDLWGQNGCLRLRGYRDPKLSPPKPK
eukprot:scaffold2224_cov189-Skeletonema_marinoi.AAC.1